MKPVYYILDAQNAKENHALSEWTALQNIEFLWDDLACLLHDLTDLVHTNASGVIPNESCKACLLRASNH